MVRANRWRRPLALIAAASLGAGAALAACGGTTGHEDLPSGSSTVTDATLNEGAADDGGAPDGTLGEGAGDDDGSFDAGIQYANPARLAAALEAAAAVAVPEGGSIEAAPPPPWASWPNCSQDSYVDNAGRKHEVPDDSGACATFDWTPTFDSGIAAPADDSGAVAQPLCQRSVQTEAGLRPPTCDECIRCSLSGVLTQGVFPPCSDLPREGGAVAAQGPGAGIPLFDLCATLFVCVSTSGCTGNGPQDPNATVGNCYCGTAMGEDCLSGKANGICKTAIEAAFQAGPSVSPTDISGNLTDLTVPESHAAAEVLGLYQSALTGNCAMCFP